MHRLASIPGDDTPEDLTLVEQPSAPVILLTSATTDIATLSSVLEERDYSHWNNRIRALPLPALSHPSQVDHYISTSTKPTKIIVVRLLGGRGHWNYGLDELDKWVKRDSSRKLIVLSGTVLEDDTLCQIGNINLEIINYISRLFIEGGSTNFKLLLDLLGNILSQSDISIDDIRINKIDDPLRWDWSEDSGEKVGIIYYKSLFQASDLELPNQLNQRLRQSNIAPKVLFVSSLKSPGVLEGVKNIFKSVNVRLILSSTSFSTINIEDADIATCIWDEINVPIIQMLTSSSSLKKWNTSSIGLSPIDLTIQVVLPELDGRIISRPVAFKELAKKSNSLSTAIHRIKPFEFGINWIANYAESIINLQVVQNHNKKIAIIVANYPNTNGRIANGVGLDTPASVIQILSWLKADGYYLGAGHIPNTSSELINHIVNSKTNDQESANKIALEYLNCDTYSSWWNSLNYEVKKVVEERWGTPEKSTHLDNKGFAINGLQFGNISILIQPSRGYDPNDSSDLHSPVLPPSHGYLAFYYWIKEKFKANAIVNVGKHGSLEWLPGKAVGLSDICFPDIVLGPIPNIYPFIVNDPGEGSQAKRRSQAVIIDHLTPPLSRATLYGELLTLESLLDEYYEARLLGSDRVKVLRKLLCSLITEKHLVDIDHTSVEKDLNNFDEIINAADSYLCELKEAQIRTGLHILGVAPPSNKLVDLLISIARAPNIQHLGITQLVANKIGMQLDPWTDDEDKEINQNDIQILKAYKLDGIRITGQAVAWIEDQTRHLVISLLYRIHRTPSYPDEYRYLVDPLKQWIKDYKIDSYFNYLINTVWLNLNKSPNCEKASFLKSLSGLRVPSGPSGAPTRGRMDVLPTGRNFYSVDLRGMPTEAAWDIGRRSAELIIDLYEMENGESLKSLAVSVWGTSTMRNGGEDICQILSLIGVRPVWDGPNRRMVDIEAIPIELLGRSRVDVTVRISGFFRDAFPQLVYWLSRSQYLISTLDEPKDSNPFAYICRDKGYQSRVFGSAPGAYGAGLQELINSGAWDNKSDLAESFVSWSQWSYDLAGESTKNKPGLVNALRNIQLIHHNQDNREHDILDSDDYYQFHGGLAAAVSSISGNEPSISFGDNSRYSRPKIHNLTREIDKVVRSRMLNPNWIEGMKSHGYKGAFEMSASLDYLFAYDATTNKVPSWCYSSIYSSWLQDKDNQQFLLEKNPWSLRDICERLLEAKNRNLWKTSTQEQISTLQNIIIHTEGVIESM